MKKLIETHRLSEEQYEKIDKLIDLALEYNEHTNITAIREKDMFWEKHIEDSLELMKLTNLRGKSVLDVGSGGGFPGLPLAIASPTSSFVLVDSNNKKTAFIKHAINKLNINNVEVVDARIETMKDSWEEKFDIVTSRAVAPLNILVEITAFAVAIDGKLVLYKGSKLDSELPMDWSSVHPLGIEYDRTYHYHLSDEVDRHIIKFNKVTSTKEEFPRDFASIKKYPIYG